MARVTQEEMDRRIAAYGGANLVHSPTASKKKVPNPAHKSNGGTSYTVPEEIDVEVQRWKGAGTGGAELEAYQLPDGSWEIVKEQPATPSATAGTNPAQAAGAESQITGTPTAYDAQGRPAAWDNSRPVRLWTRPDGTVIRADPLAGDERDRWEREKNAGAGLGSKTDAEVEKDKPTSAEGITPVEGRPGWRQKKTVKVEGGNRTEVTVYIDPQGNEVPTLPEKPGEVETQLVTINGQRYQVRKTPQGGGKPDKIEWLDPSGNPIAAPPIEAGKPIVETVDVNGRRYTKVTSIDPTTNAVKIENYDPSGNKITEIPQAGRTPYPADLPTYTPDWSDAGGDLGIGKYAREIRARNDLTDAQKTELITAAHNQATTAISRSEATVRTQEGEAGRGVTQRGQDITQAGNRGTLAASLFGNAQQQASEDTKYSTGPDAMAVMPYYLALGMAAANAMGAFASPPQVQGGPAIQQAGRMGLAPVGAYTAPGGAPPPTAPPAGAPSAAPAVDPAQHAANQRANPIFRPQPPAVYPGQPAAPAPRPMAGDPRVTGQEPGAVPPAAPPAPPPITADPRVTEQEPGAVPPQQSAPAAPPTNLKPGAQPYTPEYMPNPGGGRVLPQPYGGGGPNVQLAPPVPGPVAMAVGAGPWQQAPQQPTGALGVQMAIGDGYDPTEVNRKWLEAGVDPQLVALFGGGPGMG